ncbi:MAG: hypothetical protein KKD01_00790 [Proteobacteria bacterium]|nr:hypothetical protein [Pseudomonadota bacterium]MBU1419292.1 hypothetical protein [Pseudomonadota bacterium]MBU1453235.1 hypothetical protein [Pseudomonadota bacterium]
MKRTIKIVFVILAVAMTFFAVQNVSAKGGKDTTYTVEGTIDSISYQPNVVTVLDSEGNTTDVYGISFNYLCNQKDVCLADGDYVSIDYYEFLCDSGIIKAMATSITVDNVTFVLR